MSIEPLRLAIIGTGRRADYLYSLLHRLVIDELP